MIKNTDLKTYQRTAERGNPTLTHGRTKSKTGDQSQQDGVSRGQ
jgi:hypothetical protein